jgi:RNA polymerase sigma factor (sigma-70 family)
MGTNRFDTSRTSQTLLGRLRDSDDHQAWDEFHRRYAPMIVGWCRHWFPRETDDMVQEVFLRLTNCLKGFEYQPSKGLFRGYLKTVTNRLMADLKQRASARPAMDHEFLTQEVEARGDLVARLAAEYDLELRDIAKDRVRGRVTERTWAAFLETAECGRSPAEVARELGMKVGSVFQAKHSIIIQLRQEIEGLQGPA